MRYFVRFQKFPILLAFDYEIDQKRFSIFEITKWGKKSINFWNIWTFRCTLLSKKGVGMWWIGSGFSRFSWLSLSFYHIPSGTFMPCSNSCAIRKAFGCGRDYTPSNTRKNFNKLHCQNARKFKPKLFYRII